MLINKRESAGLKHLNGSEDFIEYSIVMDNIYQKIETYSLNKQRKILIVFDDTIADSISSKKRNPIVNELFIRDRKLKNSLVFITQSYLAAP